YRALMLLALGAWLVTGLYALLRLDIEAYPDPSPPLVEFITQNPSWSAEEMERQVTVPVETQLFGIPGLEYTRSISLFGLSDVKLYFDYGTDYFTDRQEALNRMQLVSLPNGLLPQLSPWSTVGEIYRYRLDGSGYSLNELKAVADWYVRREVKQVPGIIDVTTFGGTTRQYQAEIDPQKLLAYNVTLPQVLTAVNASNANVGGNYLTLGGQSVNVRGVGLLQTLDDMKDVIITERRGVPVFLKDVADVHEGYQPRLGRVGMDENDDIVKGTVLLQRGEQSLPALRLLRQRVTALNNGLLPPGIRVQTIYDRTDLIRVTTRTVQHLVFLGLAFVTGLLLVFLGDWRISLITALTIPASILFAFGLLVATGNSANLISIGAIDFGILVEAAVVVVEDIHRRLSGRRPGEATFDVIAAATADAAKPVLFSTLVILVAFLPLFTMRGVPGKIFGPMSLTYGFALTGALLFALVFAPVLASWTGTDTSVSPRETRVAGWFHRTYERLLPPVLVHRGLVLGVSGTALAATVLLTKLVGGQFMPKLEEGDLWVRATLPVDASLESASGLASEMRSILLRSPAVTHVVSQVGRPDDGTDVVTFNNIEFHVQLLPAGQWPPGLTKAGLIQQMSTKLSQFPGIAFGFSQNIEDNVEEAMSGVKGENSLKLFGDDIDVLALKAGQIRDVMAQVPGIQDLAIFQETGQPALVIAVDREASARYGMAAADVNAAVQAAVGGLAATQILLGDRRFDFVVRYAPPYRLTPEAIRNILLPTPEGGRVPLGQVARVDLKPGAFMIYRENGQRYIPIKFSVRGRDLASTIREAQARLRASVHLPAGYYYEWAGEYQSLQNEVRRLAIVIPISLLVILALLYTLFNSWRDALIVLAVLPFGAIGGVLSLLITGTPFSISAAVGFTSALGVGTLGGCVFLSGIRRVGRRAAQGRSHDHALEPGESPVPTSLAAVIEQGAMLELRPILMACLAAGLGLLPAAISTGIGAQAQQPLARVVVGAMITTALSILILIPVFASIAPARGRARISGRHPAA
ncbi:MAG TPA: CusA/CzcA family heavy metal efflux RND transporter, partial [Gemmatimonadales bacterium]|nr:CusA/CzcA family heavy metal efflux RND transporter [Gemmatimonadales bacterium]